VNRIDLRDRRKQRLLSLDKAALRLQSAAGDAADWRFDTRISDVEFAAVRAACADLTPALATSSADTASS
jgi:hypothetical protein